MAKKSMSMSFKNAEINLDDMTIIEVNKDDSEEFDLMTILKKWDKIPGISLTIKQDNNLSPIDEDGDED